MPTDSDAKAPTVAGAPATPAASPKEAGTATDRSATAKSETPATEKARDVESLVERWFCEAFHGSIVATQTEIYNAVHAAKEELKTKLKEFVATL